MTPDEKDSLEILIARNAVAVNAEKRKIEAVKTKAISKALARGLDAELIADINGVSVELVNAVKAKSFDNR